MTIVKTLIDKVLDDDEAFVRRHCPDLEYRETSGRLRYMIALRCNDPGSPMVVSNDIAHAWREAADAVRRELEDET